MSKNLKNATNQDTIVCDMSTTIDTNKLGTTLFGKTRRAVLALLYSHPDESYYLRQLGRLTDVGMGGLQRELKQLSEAGIIERNEIGRQAFYKANSDCPVFLELRNLIIKTFGVADVLRDALSPLADPIQVAFIFGSMVSGEFDQGRDLDIVVVGDISFADVVRALSQVPETLFREIIPSVYPPEEFKAKLFEEHLFFKTVLNSPKIFLIGDRDELDSLAR
jgi:DNA-binding transcriptional ArsR family regulator